MSAQSAVAPTAPTYPTPTVPLGEILPWAVFGLVLSGFLVYFVGAEEGATSLIAGHGVHEFFHDGRHLLGFPCH